MNTKDIPGAALGNDRRKFFKVDEETKRKSFSVQRSRPALPPAGKKVVEDSLDWLSQNYTERGSVEPQREIYNNGHGDSMIDNSAVDRENSYRQGLNYLKMASNPQKSSGVFAEEETRHVK